MSFSHLRDVLDEVAPLGRLFADAGFRLFLVGGIVRDQWLDHPLDGSSDIDMTTDASPIEIKRIVSSFAEALWTQGEKFGTIGFHANGRDYEITTHRAETYDSDSRKPVVSFGDEIEADLARRDFTVNAMAIELPDGDLVDPYHGTADLEAGLLRTPLGAEISFSDDPLRMLRSARFSAKYALTPVDELTASATALHERIRIVAIERIGVELRRLLGLAQAEVGVRFLAGTGLLAEVLSYGEPALIPQIEPKLDEAITLAMASPPDWHLALAALGLSIFDDVAGLQALCNRLRLSRDDQRAIVRIGRAAVDAATAPDLAPPTLRRWAAAHGSNQPVDPEPIVLGYRLHGAEAEAQPFIGALDALVASEDPHGYEVIDGGTIMAALDVAPGPVIGKAHTFLQEHYFEHGPVDRDAQITALQTWWATKP